MTLAIPEGDITDDGRIIDIYGNVITAKDRLSILEVIEGLPARAKIDDFLSALESPIVIVQGETGSGKTTQLPKEVHRKFPQARISVTQPRVMAAMANATRVSQELLAETGNIQYSLGRRVGYRTGKGVSSLHTSPLSFNTDGLEHRRQAGGLIPDFLILDEVHNFAIPTEVLAMLRKRTRNIAMKLVIMSATLDPQIFRDYYREIDSDIPLIQIPGRTFAVDKDLDATDNYTERIAEEYRAGQNILFFVPGKREIENEMKRLKDILGADAQIFALHAELSKEEQQFLLKKDPSDKRPRIIICTNVAEESVTIDYIDLVIDLAKQKVLRYNKQGVPGLYLEDTSDANGRQRAGRAGRTHDGRYRRYNSTPSADLPDYPEAPIEREMLDSHILTLLSQGINILDLLEEADTRGERSPFFHSIDRTLLRISFERLQKVGALTNRGELTNLGKGLLQFPVDIYLARMIIEGIERGCSGDMALIAALIEKKGFLSKEDAWKELKIGKSQESDLFAYVEIFQFMTATSLTPKQQKQLTKLGANTEEVEDFLDRKGTKKLYEVVDLTFLGIKTKKIQEIDEAYMDMLRRFELLGITPTYATGSEAIRSKKISLATGMLHYMYTYDHERRGFVHQGDRGNPGEASSVFRKGNISLIDERPNASYMGYPFIIGGDAEKGGLNLLTFITVIDQGILREAIQSNTGHSSKKYIAPKLRKIDSSPSIASPSIGSRDIDTIIVAESAGGVNIPVDSSVQPPPPKEKRRKISSTPDLMQEMDEDISYASLIEEFGKIPFSSDADAQNHFLRHCVPVFLMEENHAIRAYISGKSLEWKILFRQLLSRFLVEQSEIHRVFLGSLHKTEHSFRSDTGILQSFQETKDPIIRHFRLHGDLPSDAVGVPSSIPAIIEKGSGLIEGEGSKSREIFELRAQFARLMGEANQYKALFDADHIQEFVFHRFLARLDSADLSVGKDIAAYSDIGAAYYDIDHLSLDEQRDLTKGLKGVGRREKEYREAKIKLDYLEKLKKNLNLLIQGKNADIEILHQALRHHAFPGLSESVSARYRTTIDRIQSKDKRKNTRGQGALTRHFIPALDIYLESKKKEVTQIKRSIDLGSYPIGLRLHTALTQLIGSIFEADYAKLRISPKIIETVRAIARDPSGDKRGVQKIVFELLNQTHAAEHTHGVGDSMRQLMKYASLYEAFSEGGAFRKDVYPTILSSNDLTYIQQMLESLRGLLLLLKEEYGSLMNNNLYKSYKENQRK